MGQETLPVRWAVAEIRRVVEPALESGASAGAVARAEGVIAKQAFAWSRAYRLGRQNHDRRGLRRQTPLPGFIVFTAMMFTRLPAGLMRGADPRHPCLAGNHGGVSQARWP